MTIRDLTPVVIAHDGAYPLAVAHDDDILERFYHFIESPFDKHRVYDLKATSDGGYIFCGDVIDEDVATNGQIIQKGWLVKVDACGCLVPGCDPNCVVGIEEFKDLRIQRFKVGPNPANQLLNIHLFASAHFHFSSLHFQLHDMQGRLIKEFFPPTDNTTYMMDVEQYESGVYVLSLVDEGVVVQTEQIVIE